MKDTYLKASSDQSWLEAAQNLITKALEEQPLGKKLIIKEAKLFSPNVFRLSGWLTT